MCLLAYIANQYTYVDTKENGNDSNSVDGNFDCGSSSTEPSEFNSKSTEITISAVIERHSRLERHFD